MRPLRLRFKTIVKIIISVFVVTTCIVHYTNEKFERTGEILKGVGNRNVNLMVQPFVDTFLINNHWLRDNYNSNNKNGNVFIDNNGQQQNERDAVRGRL